ncbi:hypothetical protein PISMIDRAFT_676868 [Pisolithus microcarpus 441]|uniref:Uncharacterized protein n=1 Tax=Pisolithus microcarpus 441 TaxID=765257 RepID=A0A0C9ZIW8_9AGAM|nr:hypothetical protein PISMIDRAFT_676868 [Pisolithus microcarpus 441]
MTEYKGDTHEPVEESPIGLSVITSYNTGRCSRPCPPWSPARRGREAEAMPSIKWNQTIWDERKSGILGRTRSCSRIDDDGRDDSMMMAWRLTTRPDATPRH